MRFPDDKLFAFSILDDTDDSTLENVQPVYEKLRECGLRTTKTAWPFECPEGSRIFLAAETLENASYLDFVRGLAAEGFEIAFHGATMESSCRERTLKALEFLRKEFGDWPRLSCNHGYSRENLYWGHKRFQTWLLRQFMCIVQDRPFSHYVGEVAGSEFFWGDLCKKQIRYVRNFTFSKLNMLEVNPEMPYSLAETPYVNHWFSTADAPDVSAFNRLLSSKNVDQLEKEHGVCIVSTHFGKGFSKGGKLNKETAEILNYIARKPGWFVPVSDILDYLLANRQLPCQLGYLPRLRLESMFVFDKLIGLIRDRTNIAA